MVTRSGLTIKERVRQEEKQLEKRLEKIKQLKRGLNNNDELSNLVDLLFELELTY